MKVNSEHRYLKPICYLASKSYEQTIFFALSNSNIRETQAQYQNYGLLKQIAVGLESTAINFAITIPVFTLLGAMTSRLDHGKLPTVPATEITLGSAMLSAVAEELIFRGGLQTVIYVGQSLIYNPKIDHKPPTGVTFYLTSPAARIVCTQFVFAAMHLRNGGSYLSSKGAMFQATRIFLFPSDSTLYETTGALVAPTAAHMANNLVIGLLIAALR